MARNKIIVYFDNDTSLEIDKDSMSCPATMTIANKRALIMMKHYISDGSIQLDTYQTQISQHEGNIKKVELQLAIDGEHYLSLNALDSTEEMPLIMHYTIGNVIVNTTESTEPTYIENLSFDYTDDLRH